MNLGNWKFHSLFNQNGAGVYNWGQRLKEQGQRILVTVSWVECNETQQRKAALLNSNALKAQQVISESFNTKHGLELESY